MKLNFVTASVLCAGVLMSCTEQTSPSKADADQLPVTHGQQGMKIYIDPSTGKQSIPPAGTVLPATSNLNTSTRGLVEKPALGGGTMVDLQGRFQSSTKATVKEDGSIVIEHLPITDSSPLTKGK